MPKELFKELRYFLIFWKNDNFIWMKHFKNITMKYKFTNIIITMNTRERSDCWLNEEIKPPKIVIIMTKLATKFNEFNWWIPNGFNFISITKSKVFRSKIKNALFWLESWPPTFTREIIRIVEIFLKINTNSLKNNFTVIKKYWN